ncbi:hypothetical protein [Emticicia sp. TH156]|uniref:hypothetical protein n=1 Tax=Emticicia sp. TH156 TaxID=2067454 RepID=UPI000C7584F3|nr:hypothetical protein [Emticicia sp. TH156]PLK43032.1 hypothetical protein C0V77_16735 [Emticicia sp. TH156]
MRLNNKELYEFFREKGITFLYHANTVSTTMTYLEQRGLLSRGLVEKKGFYQTPQTSDNDDKVVGVWDDIFLDTTNLHGKFPRQNFYGPVLFCFNIEFLLKEDYEIWITKNNPWYWINTPNLSDNLKYFQNVSELRVKWEKYEQQKMMVTIRNTNQSILFDYLDYAYIDRPHIFENSEIFKNMRQILRNLLVEKGYYDKFKLQECKKESCYCHDNYLKLSNEELRRLFSAKKYLNYKNSLQKKDLI